MNNSEVYDINTAFKEVTMYLSGQDLEIHETKNSERYFALSKS